MIAQPENVFVQTLSLGEGPTTVAIKDSIDIAGVATRQGSRVLADVPPASENAEVVERLLANGGWRIAGKANMHELAFGVTGINAWSGTPRNPTWPDRIPGGSSSGSAVAVASGAVDMALGTDTGGSVRMPAACCGIVGFKPSFGLVSRHGVHPAESSLDCVGVFARSVAMIESAMTSLVTGFFPAPLWRRPALAVVTPPVSSDVAEAIEKALASCFADRRTAALPGLSAAFDAGLVIIGAENWRAMGQWIASPHLGEDVRGRLCAGAQYSPADVAAAEVVRAHFATEVDRLLDDADAIVLPTLPIVPPTLKEAGDARACVPLTRLVRPFNLSGHPAITLPLRTAHDLPAGLQLVGRKGGDAALCGVASALSRALGLGS